MAWPARESSCFAELTPELVWLRAQRLMEARVMRLAVCIFKYFPYGGIQRDMMKIVDECQRRGHEIQVFTLRWEAPRPDNLAVHVLPIVGF